ncbi:MAG: IrrE N-terminal-like domain [Pseudomonadota bacterium]|jgi:Zn-dependent peptidase ImmA (M78 family)
MIAIFPQLAACAKSRDLEKLAVLVRTQYGFTVPKLDADALLQATGIDVESLELDCAGNLLVQDEKGQFAIIAVLPQKLHDEVRRFRLAHLLGHFLLHVQHKIADGTFKGHGFQEVECPYARYVSGKAPALQSREEVDAELAADEFAAALLMPKSLVEAALAKGATPDALASFFGCPVALVQRRLAYLGVLKQDVTKGMARLREIASQLEHTRKPASGDKAAPATGKSRSARRPAVK